MASLTPSDDLTASPYILPRDRDAYYVIRGFVFQVQRTIQSWLRLAHNEFLVLECGEDVDHVSRVLVDKTWHEDRELEQIKSREKRITLRDGCEPFANFADHRRANPGQALRFRFTTTGVPTTERPLVMGKSPKKTKASKITEPIKSKEAKMGINLWREVAQGSAKGDERAQILAKLKSFLLDECVGQLTDKDKEETKRPKKVPEEVWNNFRQFLQTSSETDWSDFVTRFEWETGVAEVSELSPHIQAELQEIGAAATESEARTIYERLFVNVIFLLSKEGSKLLHADKWREVGKIELSADNKRWLKQLSGDLEALKFRVTAVEARTDKLEVVAEDLSLQMAIQERAISQGGAAQSVGFAAVQATQDAHSGSLAQIATQLADLQRTRTVDELKNSPEAREWTLELQIESTRLLLNQGKISAAKIQLEQHRCEADGLREGPTKKRLLSRILGNMALCEWRIGNLASAAQLYRDAYDVQRDDAKVTANAGFGALLKDDAQEALRLGQRALDQDPASDDGMSVVVRALHLLQRDDEIASFIESYPLAVDGIQTLFTLGGLAIWNEDDQASQDYAQRLCDIAPQNPNSHRLRCDAHFFPIQRRWRNDPPLLMRFSDEERAHLEIAEDAASTAIELMKDWDVGTLRVEALANRAAIREALGKIDGEDGALSDCKAALATSPDDPMVLLTHGEILLHRKRDPAAAIPLLMRVVESNTAENQALPENKRHLSEDAAVLCAEAHVDLRQWSQVTALLEPIYRPEPSQREQMDLARLLAQAAFFTNDTARLTKIKTDLKANFPDDTAALMTLADIAYYENDFVRHAALMQEVYYGATGERRQRATFLLARARIFNGEPDVAIDLLQPLVDSTSTDSAEPDLIARLYLEALHRAKRQKEAYDYAVQARNGGRAVKGISDYEADYAVEQGDNDHALRLLDELSSDNPDNVNYARNLASLSLTNGKQNREGEDDQFGQSNNQITPEAIEVAGTALRRVPFERVKENPVELIDFARLRHLAGFADAPEWAYKAVRLAPNDAQIGGLYLAYITMNVAGDDPRFYSEVVGLESAVELKRRRQRETWIITENPTADPHELTPDHPFAQRMLGKREGDKISFSEEQPLNRDDYQIVSVKSKYVQAVHDLTRKFEGGVLQQNWMAVGHFSSLNTVEGCEEERDALRELLESGVSVGDLYEKSAVFVATIAQLTGRKVPDLWRAESPSGGYSVAPKGHFFVSDGTMDEISREKDTVTVAKEFVLDWTALITIVHLELEEVVRDAHVRLVIAKELVAEAESYVEFHAHHDADFEDEETPQDQKRRAFSRRLHAFAMSCDKVVEFEWNNMDEERAKTHGRATIATIKVAQEQKLSLWSDDLRLRRSARELYQVPGVNTQTLVEHLLEGDLITSEVAHETLRRFIMANYGLLRFSTTFLLWILRRNNMRATKEVRRVFRNLAFWKTHQEIAVAVTANVLIEICKMQFLTQHRTEIGSALLYAMSEGHREKATINLLLNRVRSMLRMNVTLLAVVEGMIVTWRDTKIQKH